MQGRKPRHQDTVQLRQGHRAGQESRQQLLGCIRPVYKQGHTHRATHLKGLYLPATNVEQAKQKRIAAVPDKVKRFMMHSREGKRRGSSWEVLATETCFHKTNETQGKPQTSSVVWEQVVLDLPALSSPARRKPTTQCLWNSCFLTMTSAQ